MNGGIGGGGGAFYHTFPIPSQPAPSTLSPTLEKTRIGSIWVGWGDGRQYWPFGGLGLSPPTYHYISPLRCSLPLAVQKLSSSLAWEGGGCPLPNHCCATSSFILGGSFPQGFLKKNPIFWYLNETRLLWSNVCLCFLFAFFLVLLSGVRSQDREEMPLSLSPWQQLCCLSCCHGWAARARQIACLFLYPSLLAHNLFQKESLLLQGVEKSDSH